MRDVSLLIAAFRRGQLRVRGWASALPAYPADSILPALATRAGGETVVVPE